MSLKFYLKNDKEVQVVKRPVITNLIIKKLKILIIEKKDVKIIEIVSEEVIHQKNCRAKKFLHC
jgi:hypothetical protein